MTFDLPSILESKRAYRRHLAARPIAEKLAILDEMRARTLALRPAHEINQGSSILREEPTHYRSKNSQK